MYLKPCALLPGRVGNGMLLAISFSVCVFVSFSWLTMTKQEPLQ